MVLAVLGISLVIPLTLASGRLLNSQLYGVNPRDPVVVAIACTSLALTAILAALIPAIRASSISPRDAIRTE
jgi:putative ABC transport system permease protein